MKSVKWIGSNLNSRGEEEFVWGFFVLNPMFNYAYYTLAHKCNTLQLLAIPASYENFFCHKSRKEKVFPKFTLSTITNWTQN